MKNKSKYVKKLNSQQKLVADTGRVQLCCLLNITGR
jgi:hypothetical protein